MRGHVLRLLSHDKPVIPGSHLLHTHQVCRADVTSHISSTASSFLQFLSLLSLSYFPPSPLHITLSPRALTLYLSHSSHPPPLSLASFPSDFFFFFTAAPYTPLVAAASLLKVQNWLVLLPWWWRLWHYQHGSGLVWLTERLHKHSPCRQALAQLQINFRSVGLGLAGCKGEIKRVYVTQLNNIEPN